MAVKVRSGSEWIDVSGGGTSNIPVGVIVMWSGSIASIPSGWNLCDGSNGTPDLRDRFIVGASVDVSGVTNTTIAGGASKTGGTKDAVVVSHTHGYTAPSGLSLVDIPEDIFDTKNVVATAISGTTSAPVGSVAGTNQNLPPYYALAFIMKI